MSAIDLSKMPKLGFGLMRLPLIDGKIDHEEVCKMVDLYREIKYPNEENVLSELWFLINSRWINRLFLGDKEEKNGTSFEMPFRR